MIRASPSRGPFAVAACLGLALVLALAAFASVRSQPQIVASSLRATGTNVRSGLPARFANQNPIFTLRQGRAQTQVLLNKRKGQCGDFKSRSSVAAGIASVGSTVAEAPLETKTVKGMVALTERAKQNEKIGVQAVILDLDGVILDYEEASNSALNEVLQKYNKSGSVGVDWNLHSKIMGLRIHEMAEVVLGVNRLLDRVDPGRFVTRYYDAMGEKYSSLKLKPGALDMVHALKKAGFPIALATSSSKESLDRKMKGNYDEILGMFDEIITGDDAQVNFGKKSTEMFLLAAERMGADPKKVLVIDDSPMAVWSAKAAGMYVASCPDDRFTQDFTNGGPDFQVESLEDFASLDGISKIPLERTSSEDLPKAEFNDMPVTVGFGTDLIHTAQDGSLTCDDKILSAIEAGYRLIDTATKYESEPDTGRALQEAMKQGMKREDFYVVTKVWVNDMGYTSAIESVEKSLKRLQLDYVDLVLIHWPGPAPGKPEAQQFGWENKAKRTLTWRALEELVLQGKIKSIGVANWTIRHLKETLAVAEIPPTVNQVEMHPYYTRNRLLKYCTEHGIKLMGYSPFGRGRLNIINDPVMGAIGEKYGKSGAQVILKWMVQRGVVPLPRASSENRIKQNYDIFDFDLTDEEMETITNLNGDKRSCSIDCHSIP